METGKLIKEKREELGMTMKELSKKVGVSEGTVSRWDLYPVFRGSPKRLQSP